MGKRNSMNQTVNKTKLDNGVCIITKRIPNVRSVTMGVWVNSGARDESKTENGLSHFIEHMIFKGTRQRSAYQIAKEFDAIGGHTNAFTAMESTCYHAKVMDTHTETMVDILSDIFLNSLFDEAEIERERMVIFQEIGMVEDTPEDYIHILTGATYWGDNPLGRSILGTRENISRFNTQDLRNFFHRFYQPDRIVISAAGALEHNHMVDLLEPTFGFIKPVGGFPERVTPMGQSIFNLHTRQIEQAHICISTRGLSIKDPRRYTFSLLNTIFGGNMSSRLFQEIRENKSLAYSVYSFISSHTDTGMFGIYAAVDPKKAAETVALVIKELRRIRENTVHQSELQNAKEFSKGSMLLASESVDNQMVRLAQNEIHFGRYIPLQYVVDKIEGVTVEDVHALINVLLEEERLTMNILGPISDKSDFDDLLYL
jgi:predicted Zn-dependent peptidase